VQFHAIHFLNSTNNYDQWLTYVQLNHCIDSASHRQPYKTYLRCCINNGQNRCCYW